MPSPALPDFPTPQLIRVDACHASSDNRDLSDDPLLAELADSIRVVGLLHPIHVRPVTVPDTDPDPATDPAPRPRSRPPSPDADPDPDPGVAYEILAGVRRWMAHRLIDAPTIPAVVHLDCDDATAQQIRFIENEHRKEATAYDTARALRRIKNENAYSHSQVAGATGIDVSRVKRYLSLFAASDALLEAVQRHGVPVSVAVELVRFEKSHGEAKARGLVKQAVAGELTVRDIAARRKRSARGASKKAPRDPWASVERRVSALFAQDPKDAKRRLSALVKRLAEAG